MTPAKMRSFIAPIPIAFKAPIKPRIIREVFSGEYETGYCGTGLTILDIGANVGAFSLWAAHRWPGSRIEAFEANPLTFDVLCANAQDYNMIACHNCAVYPASGTMAFFHRGAGDGGAGLVEKAVETYEEQAIGEGHVIEVTVLQPRSLPAADIVKIDVEGAEAEIVTGADWQATSLIMLEFQNLAQLNAIKQHLAGDFDIVGEKHVSWDDDLLKSSFYRRSLAGDFYGTAFFLRRGQTRLSAATA